MAKRSDKEIREQEVLDMRAVMDIPGGRRLIRRLLASCGVFKSVVRLREGLQPGERILFNAGQQDIGHFIMAEAQEAHPIAFEKMNSEAAAMALMERESE